MNRPKDNKIAKFKEWKGEKYSFEKGEKYSFEKGEIFWRNCFGAESRPLTLGSPHDSLIKMPTSETRWWWSSWKWWWWYVSWSHDDDDDDGGFLKSLIRHYKVNYLHFNKIVTKITRKILMMIVLRSAWQRVYWLTLDDHQNSHLWSSQGWYNVMNANIGVLS